MVKRKYLYCCVRAFLPVLASGFAIDALAQDLSHRKSDVTITAFDALGYPLADATLDVQMTQHAFKFGTQIRDRFFSISQVEFDALSVTQKQNLLPDLSGLGQPVPYTPVWQDVLNYRQAVYDHFNFVVPTTGMQWLAFENNGPAVPDSAISLAQSNGKSVAAASVVWPRDDWPTPTEFRSDAIPPPDPNVFHTQLIADRLSATGIMGRYSDSGAGPTVSEWKVLNEPLHNTYFADVFVNAGIYPDEATALADFFIRANTVRPDSVLSINEYNILNFANDNEAIVYRDFINGLLAAGAPIDRIGVQAHMSQVVSKAAMLSRINILAQTGLPIEITEFDMRDDAAQLTPAEQQQIFQDLLEVAFESPAVVGFIMWGFWDPGHWRGNGPLYNENWTTKTTEASPWFNLVEGTWMTDLAGLAFNNNGQWTAPDGVFSGLYDFTVTVAGTPTLFEDYDLGGDGNFVLNVPVIGDLDNDTLLNDVDNCPYETNLNQDDLDGDGTGDVCDADIDGDGLANGDALTFTFNNHSNQFNKSALTFWTAPGAATSYSEDDVLPPAGSGDYYLTVTAKDQELDASGNPIGLADASLATQISGLGIKGPSDVGDWFIAGEEQLIFTLADEFGAAVQFANVVMDSSTNNLTADEHASINVKGLTYKFNGAAGGGPLDESLKLPAGSQGWASEEASRIIVKSEYSGQAQTAWRVSELSLVTVPFSSDFDDLDNCPTTANPNQADFDGDGLGDACDDDIDGDGTLNSAEAGPADDQDGDGVVNSADLFPTDSSETNDADSDGVGDNGDNCAEDANASQADLDGDGQGDACDADIDGDNVINSIENGAGTDPNDANDVPSDLFVAVAENQAEELVIPMVGPVGLLALGLSMLGLGVLGRRK